MPVVIYIHINLIWKIFVESWIENEALWNIISSEVDNKIEKSF